MDLDFVGEFVFLFNTTLHSKIKNANSNDPCDDGPHNVHVTDSRMTRARIIYKNMHKPILRDCFANRVE